MLCDMTLLKELHKKTFYLASPDKTILGVIPDPQDKKGTFKLTPYSEISFSVRKTGENSLIYDQITKMQKVFIEDIGWFILDEPTISLDGTSQTKSCQMYSAEHELTHRMLRSFYLNTNDAGSIGSMENGFAEFYNAENPEKSALHLVLEKYPGWSIGYVHPLLANKKAIGSFSVDSQDVYSFLTDDLSKAAECLFLFDIMDFTISAYPWSQFGETFDVFLSHDSLIKSLRCSPVDEDDLVTALAVSGADGLSIREVNCGFDYLYDLTYFYDKMPPGLVSSWKAYQIKFNGRIKDYRESIVTYTKSKESCGLLQNILPAQADSEDWAEYGIAALTSILNNTNLTIENYINMGFHEIDSEYYKDYIRYVEKKNTLQAEISKKESEYQQLEKMAEENLANLQTIAADVSWENNFTPEQISLLSSYIREGDFEDDTFLTTDIFTYEQIIQKKWELKEHAAECLSEMSQPQYAIDTELVNLAELPAYAPILDKISLGHLITVMFNDFVDIPLRLLSFSLDFDDISTVSVEYSNMKRSRNGISDLAYLLDNSSSSSRRSSASHSGQGGSGSMSSDEYVTHEELKSQLFNLSIGSSSGAAFSSQELGYLNALVNGRFNTLEGSYLVTKIIEADEGTIGRLTSSILSSGYADIDRIVSENADIKVLESQAANIDTLLSGNVGSGLVQTIHLTADNVSIEDAFVKELISSKISVGDLVAHTSSANEIVLISDESNNPLIAFKNGTQQFYDDNGKVRVQIGRDEMGRFSFVLYDESGTGILLDSTGIKESAIQDGLIKNDMLAGRITKDKLGFNTVDTDENGKVDISSITADGQGLDVKFTTIEEKVTDLISDIDIGGRNLLTETSDIYNDITVDKNRGSLYPPLIIADIDLAPKEKITFSFFAKTVSGKKLRAEIEFYNSPDNKSSIFSENFLQSQEGRLYVTAPVKEGFSQIRLYINADLTSSTISSTSVEFVRCLKLERGNRPTDWTPAPEDMNSRLAEITSTIDNVSLTVDQNTKSIEQKVSKSQIVTVKQDIKNDEGDQITEEVEKNIIDAVNHTIQRVEDTRSQISKTTTTMDGLQTSIQELNNQTISTAESLETKIKDLTVIKNTEDEPMTVQEFFNDYKQTAREETSRMTAFFENALSNGSVLSGTFESFVTRTAEQLTASFVKSEELDTIRSDISHTAEMTSFMYTRYFSPDTTGIRFSQNGLTVYRSDGSDSIISRTVLDENGLTGYARISDAETKIFYLTDTGSSQKETTVDTGVINFKASMNDSSPSFKTEVQNMTRGGNIKKVLVFIKP
ncbi:hypothetical protein LQE92_07540 [Lacrimispora sp. NSJ-141]|uniref:Uncharacterized protein n=1 Tax=Lientehia hominis TaxID=2897778 RepID=A0AAP2RJE9_9FIRM|nr:hypothetical protein [Lientehia hominis]MCD2492483.1 hypothetical protein [Lientehia hominis]